MPPDDEEALIDRAVAGDEGALEALFRRHYTTMHRFAQKVCGNADDAEDVAHDAFVRMMGAIRSYNRKGAFTSWMYRVVLNRAIDCRRSDRRRHRLASEFGHVMPDRGEPAQDTAMAARQTVDIILGFPERERDAALLVMGEGLTHAEAAEIIGCPVGTIGWLLTRAGDRLKSILETDSHDRESSEVCLRPAGHQGSAARG